MKDLTVIIPVMRLDNDNLKNLVNNAINSANDGETSIVVVGSANVIKEAKTLESCKDKANVTFVKNDGNYQANINKVAGSIETKYFIVLDTCYSLTKNWYKDVQQYIDYDTDDNSIYLSLMEAMDENHNTVSYLNEANWATSFSEVIGQLDLNSTMDYANYHISGAVIRTSDFNEVGALKESMNEAFWYEFILRSLKQKKNIFVVPKIGAYAYSGDNPSWDGKEVSDDETNWWFDLAKKEYIFPKDRNIAYEK